MSLPGYLQTFRRVSRSGRFDPDNGYHRREIASGFNDERAALEKANDSLTRRGYERARNVRRGFVLGFPD